MSTNSKSADQILEELFSSLGEYKASEEIQSAVCGENKDVSVEIKEEKNVKEPETNDRDYRKRKKKRKQSEDNEKKTKHKKSRKEKKKKSHRKKDKSDKSKSERKAKNDASTEKQNERKMKEMENNMSEDRLDEPRTDENEKKKINEKNESKKYPKEEYRSKKEYDRNRIAEKDRGSRKHGKDHDSRRRDRSKYKESSRKKSSRSRERSPAKFRSRSRSRSPIKFRSRSRSRSTSPHIDKAQLLEFARKNLKRMQETGTLTLPKGISEEKFRVLKSGGKTVEELTNYCKHLSRQGNSPDENERAGGDSEQDEYAIEKPFTRHPFQIKARSDPIVLNIRNGIPLPVRKPEERVAAQAQLKQQFPVSSGQQHLELEWVPVSPAKEEPKKVKLGANDGAVPIAQGSQPVPNLAAVPPMPREISSNAPADNIDIGLVIARRISAMKKLQDNGQDIQAQLELKEADVLTSNWANTHYTNPVTGEPMREFIDWSIAPQAWARKDQFTNAAPVAGGVGMKLLQKMGWQPGEGLGRNKEGTLEPLALDIKMDKKGLVSKEEIVSKPVIMKLMQGFQGKHPVSILHELCTKKRWGPPCFEQVADIGPDHQKHFLFKVIVNGVEYRPCVASTTKKEAKAQSAAVCLQALGILPQM